MRLTNFQFVKYTLKKNETVVSNKEKLSELIDKTNNLYDCLKQLAFGQDEAVRLFAEGYFQSQVTNSADIKKKGPSATFLFAGPPGVGKTHLATSVSDILKIPFTSFDMSEFSAEDTVQRLAGFADTFRSPKPGELTGFVKKNPECIVLLDEIEKAHQDVIYEFYKKPENFGELQYLKPNSTDSTAIDYKCFIPDSVETIDDDAFKGCTAMRKPWIPERIKYISKTAFDNPEW